MKTDDGLLRQGDLLVAGDVVASIAIHYHAGGALSVSGNIGDAQLALAMLDHARDAVNGQLKRRSELIVPNRDVDLVQANGYPTRPAGDMPESP